MMGTKEISTLTLLIARENLSTYYLYSVRTYFGALPDKIILLSVRGLFSLSVGQYPLREICLMYATVGELASCNWLTL